MKITNSNRIHRDIAPVIERTISMELFCKCSACALIGNGPRSCTAALAHGECQFRLKAARNNLAYSDPNGCAMPARAVSEEVQS
jgi:hypothetical protein